jgi:hypothetical protein
MASIQILSSDQIARMNNFALSGLVQNFNWQPVFNAQDIFELGKRTRVDTSYELETSGSFEVLGHGALAGMLARMQVTRDGTGKFTGYAFDPTGGGGLNGYTLTEASFRDLRFDMVLHEQTDQATYDRAVWIPACTLTSVSGRFDANGLASETYNWAGQFAQVFGAPYHDIASVPCMRGTVTGTLEQLLAVDLVSPTWKIAYVVIDDRIFTSKATDNTYFTLDVAGLLTMTTSEGYVIPAACVARTVLFKVTPSTTFPTLANGDRLTSCRYAKGNQVNIYIDPSTPATPASSDQWLRLQSMDFTIDLRNEALRHIALNTYGSSIYFRAPTFPLSIRINASGLMSDLSTWKNLMTKTFSGTDVLDHTLEFSPSTIKQSFAIVVQVYTKDGTLLQHLRFTDSRIESFGSSVNVGGRATETWGFSATEFTLIGSNA